MADSDDFPIVSKLIYLLNYSIAEFGVLSRGKTRVINYGRIIAGWQTNLEETIYNTIATGQ